MSVDMPLQCSQSMTSAVAHPTLTRPYRPGLQLAFLAEARDRKPWAGTGLKGKNELGLTSRRG